MAERTLDLQRVETYWLLVSHHFEGLLIDLSLFDFREGEKPKVLQGVKREVPVERAYDEVMMLLDEYYRGKDILWRPSFYFKLKRPVPIEEADRLQKELARYLGDITAGSFFHHRQIAGLCNGKYEEDPITKLFYCWKVVSLTPQEIYTLNSEGEENLKETNYEGLPQGDDGILHPVVNVEGRYRSFPIYWWESFLEIKDEDIDSEATDLAWATYMAKKAMQAGWDETTTALTVLHYLKSHSPEVGRRRKIPQLAWDYLFKTVWKAMHEAKKDFPNFVSRKLKGSI